MQATHFLNRNHPQKLGGNFERRAISNMTTRWRWFWIYQNFPSLVQALEINGQCVPGSGPCSFPSLWPRFEDGLILSSTTTAGGKIHALIPAQSSCISSVPLTHLGHFLGPKKFWLVCWLCLCLSSSPPPIPLSLVRLWDPCRKRLSPVTQIFVHMRHSITVVLKFQLIIRWFGK